MKNFTLFFTFLLMMFVSFAQTPVITKLWEHNLQADGVVPDWIGDQTERDMEYYDGKIYVVSRKSGNQMLVLDPETGLPLTNQTFDFPEDPVSGGVYSVNAIDITPSGKILISNLTTSSKTDNFKVYMLTPKDGEAGYDISTVLDWGNPDSEDQLGFRCGDDFSIYGDLTEGSNGYLITGNKNSMHVLKWNIQNGAIAAQPDIIELERLYPEHASPKLNFAPVFCPIDMERFLVNSARMFPAVYNMNGVLLNAFDGEEAPKAFGIAGVAHFNFKGRSFVVSATTNYLEKVYPPSAFEIFEITGGEYNLRQATSLGILPEQGMGDAPNKTYVEQISVNLNDDKAIFYLMTPCLGIVAYKLTIGDETAADALNKSEIVIYPVPASDILRFSKEMTDIKIFSMTGQLVLNKENTSQVYVKGLSGSYIVKATGSNGLSLIRKVLIK